MKAFLGYSGTSASAVRAAFVVMAALCLGTGQLATAQETTTMKPMAGNGDTTTMGSVMDTTTAATGANGTKDNCNEEEMKKQNNCCKPVINLTASDAEEVVKKVVEMENTKNNKTQWMVDNIESAEKKECVPEIYKVQAKLSKMITGENATTVDCQMRFRVSADESFNVEMFCNGGAQLSAVLMAALLMPLATLLFNSRMNNH